MNRARIVWTQQQHGELQSVVVRYVDEDQAAIRDAFVRLIQSAIIEPGDYFTVRAIDVESALAELCEEYAAWNRAQGLNLGSSGDHENDPKLTDEQRAWVRDFSRRWDEAADLRATRYALANLRAACSRMPVPMGNYADLEEALHAIELLLNDGCAPTEFAERRAREVLTKHKRPA